MYKTFALEITKRCNLSCSYCYLGKEKQSAEMSEAIASKAIHLLLDDAKKNSYTPTLIFFGGEPLLNISLIKYCINLCNELQKKGYPETKFSMTTNGTLLDAETIDYLNQKSVGITISLDGDKDTHDLHRKTCDQKGSYDTICQNINYLNKSRAGIGEKGYSVRATLTNKHTDINKIVNHFEEIGIPAYRIVPAVIYDDVDNIRVNKEDISAIVKAQVEIFRNDMFDNEHIKDQIFSEFLGKKLINIGTEYHCGACRNYWGIDVDGNILPCHRFFGLSEYTVGNIEEGITNTALMNELNVKVQEREGCGNCDIKYLCGGTCYFDSLVNYGDTKKIDPIMCHYVKEIHKQFDDLIDEIGKNQKGLYEKILKEIAVNLKHRGGSLTTSRHNLLNSFDYDKSILSQRFEQKKVKLFDLKREYLLISADDIFNNYVINTTSKPIWDLVDGENTSADIVKKLSEIYEINPLEIQDDVCEQLALYEKMNFIEKSC